jgi:DNA-directed RNA polymerase specialized sigma24 family protein
MTSRRIRCICGTRLKLPKGQLLPPCAHIARTRPEEPGQGEHDFFRYWTPRIVERAASPGHRHTRARSTRADKDLAGLAPDPTRHELVKAGFVRPGVERGMGPAAKGPAHSAREERAIRRAERDEIREAREARQLAGLIRQRDVRRREWAAILPHLSQATDKQREAYRLHVEQGHSFKEIASLLRISEDAVKDRLKKARQHEQTSRRQAKIA